MSDKLFGGATAAALKGVLDEILEEEKTLARSVPWFKPLKVSTGNDYEMQMVGVPYTNSMSAAIAAQNQAYLQQLHEQQTYFNDLINSPHLHCVTRAPAPVAKKCTCGGQKYGGGTCSDWCDSHA